jgi:uncharacterized protein (TIGR03437 family)
VAPPQITKVVSAADGVSPAAPGGLISIYGSQLSPTNLATSEIPLPTALANSCVTIDGQPIPLIFVSPNQVNAEMPIEALGDVTVDVYTPGGESANYNMVVLPNAPAVFLSGVAGPDTNLPTVIDASNNLLVTDSNPVHHGDTLVIYLTGCGLTNPTVADGQPSPSRSAGVFYHAAHGNARWHAAVRHLRRSYAGRSWSVPDQRDGRRQYAHRSRCSARDYAGKLLAVDFLAGD